MSSFYRVLVTLHHFRFATSLRTNTRDANQYCHSHLRPEFSTVKFRRQSDYLLFFFNAFLSNTEVRISAIFGFVKIFFRSVPPFKWLCRKKKRRNVAGNTTQSSSLSEFWTNRKREDDIVLTALANNSEKKNKV